MKRNKLFKLVLAALLSAIIFAGTQFLKVPLLFGYFNLGDCFILFSAVILGGPYAMLASAVGSVLADVLSGYAVYAPATLIIKPLMVLAFITVLRIREKNKSKMYRLLLLIAGAVLSELIMVGGYFVCDVILYKFAGAVAAVAGSIVQGAVATTVSVILITVFERSSLLRLKNLK